MLLLLYSFTSRNNGKKFKAEELGRKSCFTWKRRKGEGAWRTPLSSAAAAQQSEPAFGRSGRGCGAARGPAGRLPQRGKPQALPAAAGRAAFAGGAAARARRGAPRDKAARAKGRLPPFASSGSTSPWDAPPALPDARSPWPTRQRPAPPPPIRASLVFIFEFFLPTEGAAAPSAAALTAPGTTAPAAHRAPGPAASASAAGWGVAARGHGGPGRGRAEAERKTEEQNQKESGGRWVGWGAVRDWQSPRREALGRRVPRRGRGPGARGRPGSAELGRGCR